MKSLVFFEVLEMSEREIFMYCKKYNILSIAWEPGSGKLADIWAYMNENARWEKGPFLNLEKILIVTRFRLSGWSAVTFSEKVWNPVYKSWILKCSQSPNSWEVSLFPSRTAFLQTRGLCRSFLTPLGSLKFTVSQLSQLGWGWMPAWGLSPCLCGCGHS